MMKKCIIAVVTIAVASISPTIAYAGEDHGGGHGGENMHKNAPTQVGAREIEVTAGRFRFKPNVITVAPGEDVNVVMRSTDLFHDFFVKGEGHVVGAKAKKTKEGGLRLDEPGTYKFWCTVNGHRAAGMKGTIVVQ